MEQPELAIQLPLEYHLAEDSEPVAEITGPEFGESFEQFADSGDEHALLKYVNSLKPTVVKLDVSHEEEGFDASDDVITFVETPTAPVYIPPVPLRIEKRAQVETDHELRKAAKKPKLLKEWVRSMKSQGSTRASLVEYAEKSDARLASDIGYAWDTLDEPTWEPGDPA